MMVLALLHKRVIDVVEQQEAHQDYYYSIFLVRTQAR
jgi:hypothetical protein